jgi:hypothetical protein
MIWKSYGSGSAPPFLQFDTCVEVKPYTLFTGGREGVSCKDLPADQPGRPGAVLVGHVRDMRQHAAWRLQLPHRPGDHHRCRSSLQISLVHLILWLFYLVVSVVHGLFLSSCSFSLMASFVRD